MLQSANFKIADLALASEWSEFAPEAYSAALDEVAIAVTRHLEEAHDHALDIRSPQEAVAALADVARSGTPEEVLRSYIQLHLATAPHLTSRGSMARQFSSVLPVSAAIDALISMVPQPGSFFEVGPLPNAADKLIQAEFEMLLGWQPGKGRMVSTSGGSLANMTAILAARNAMVEGSWTSGLATTRSRPAVALGADAHYSMERAIGVLGIGTDQIVRLPVDAQRRICPEGRGWHSTGRAMPG